MTEDARPNSDELAILIAFLGRLAGLGVVSDLTLRTVTDELQTAALRGERPEQGLTNRLIVEFKDGTVFEHENAKS